MTAADLAFVLASALALGGGAALVASRRSPLAQAAGLAVSTCGVAWACGLAGAPLVGGLQAMVGIGSALVVALFGVDWVGTGRDGLARPSTGRVLGRVLVAAALLAAVVAGGQEMLKEMPAPAAGALAPPPVGPGLFGAGLRVVGTAGLLLLAAIVGATVLMGRGRS